MKDKEAKTSQKKAKQKTTQKVSVEKKSKKHIYISYTSRLTIYLILLIISLIFCFSFTSRTIEREKLSPITYNKKGTIDYKVYLNDNKFYSENYLEMNKAYIASLINYIDINYHYLFTIEENTNMNFDYRIVGELVIENSNGTHRYFEKEYPLLENKKQKLIDGKSLNIDENIKINYSYYNELANSFRNTYGVDTNSYLNLYLQVDSSTFKDINYSINENDKLLLKIPLSEKAIEINIDASNQNITKEVIPVGKVIFNLKYLILEIIFFLISSFFLVKCINHLVVLKKPKNLYDNYVNKILKEYDRLVVETYTNINISNYNIIEVKKFTELLDVRDNLKVPILYYNIVKHQKGYFYIKDNNDIYLLTIKNTDLLKK